VSRVAWWFLLCCAVTLISCQLPSPSRGEKAGSASADSSATPVMMKSHRQISCGKKAKRYLFTTADGAAAKSPDAKSVEAALEAKKNRLIASQQALVVAIDATSGEVAAEKEQICDTVIRLFDIFSQIGKYYYKTIDDDLYLSSFMHGFQVSKNIPLQALDATLAAQKTDDSTLEAKQFAQRIIELIKINKASDSSWSLEKAKHKTLDDLMSQLDEGSSMLWPEQWLKLTSANNRQGDLSKQTKDRLKPSASEVIAKRLNPQVVYVRIESIQQQTAKNLDNALNELAAQSASLPHGLILDLRANPGGVLSAAIEISDLFVDKGLIVTLQGRAAASTLQFQASTAINKNYRDAKIAILVDDKTASGAVIVASALRSLRGAIIIGTPTQQRATVQSLLPLKEKNTAIKISTSLIRLPNTEASEKLAFYPDYCSRLDAKKQQLDMVKISNRDSSCQRNHFEDTRLGQQEVDFARAVVGTMHLDR